MHIGVQEHPVEGDHASKSDVITEHQENEKDVSSTQSPVESVTPAAEHVTAKTWIVIFVSALKNEFENLGEMEC